MGVFVKGSSGFWVQDAALPGRVTPELLLYAFVVAPCLFPQPASTLQPFYRTVLHAPPNMLLPARAVGGKTAPKVSLGCAWLPRHSAKCADRMNKVSPARAACTRYGLDSNCEGRQSLPGAVHSTASLVRAHSNTPTPGSRGLVLFALLCHMRVLPSPHAPTPTPGSSPALLVTTVHLSFLSVSPLPPPSHGDSLYYPCPVHSMVSLCHVPPRHVPPCHLFSCRNYNVSPRQAEASVNHYLQHRTLPYTGGFLIAPQSESQRLRQLPPAPASASTAPHAEDLPPPPSHLAASGTDTGTDGAGAVQGPPYGSAADGGGGGQQAVWAEGAAEAAQGAGEWAGVQGDGTGAGDAFAPDGVGAVHADRAPPGTRSYSSTTRGSSSSRTTTSSSTSGGGAAASPPSAPPDLPESEADLVGVLLGGRRKGRGPSPAAHHIPQQEQQPPLTPGGELRPDPGHKPDKWLDFPDFGGEAVAVAAEAAGEAAALEARAEAGAEAAAEAGAEVGKKAAKGTKKRTTGAAKKKAAAAAVEGAEGAGAGEAGAAGAEAEAVAAAPKKPKAKAATSKRTKKAETAATAAAVTEGGAGTGAAAGPPAPLPPPPYVNWDLRPPPEPTLVPGTGVGFESKYYDIGMDGYATKEPLLAETPPDVLIVDNGERLAYMVVLCVYVIRIISVYSVLSDGYATTEPLLAETPPDVLIVDSGEPTAYGCGPGGYPAVARRLLGELQACCRQWRMVSSTPPTSSICPPDSAFHGSVVVPWFRWFPAEVACSSPRHAGPIPHRQSALQLPQPAQCSPFCQLFAAEVALRVVGVLTAVVRRHYPTPLLSMCITAAPCTIPSFLPRVRSRVGSARGGHAAVRGVQALSNLAPPDMLEKRFLYPYNCNVKYR